MLVLNRSPIHGAPLEASDAAVLGDAGAAAAMAFYAAEEAYRPTPLHDLPALAAELGLERLVVKDEGQRLGLGSFKALGGAYAVARLAAEAPGPADQMTFACATAGNHGRSVAYGAQRLGARAVIFVPSGVSEGRIAAMAAFGAQMVRTESPYDDAVALAAEIAEERGWALVSDTAFPGYERIPSLIMQGYTVIAEEALSAMSEPPTHLFVQAGVGGLAGAMAGRLATRFGERRPKVVVVEPERAACLMESARAGRLVRLGGGGGTVMSMLDCQQPSLVAWRILERAADAFMAVGDEGAAQAKRRLARPVGADPAISGGESGVAGLAGLIRAALDPAARDELGLDARSRVWVINSETAAP
ncbi:diaminopropionate ammonia-lyase [Phenylobacterium montanum]|uniref:Diaminopropionate ammonia-lyase n=1 Tax=Phenylobacterium montanum TaxID=2823693 RepID=A0A975FXR9_9CAUL|nr:diaminopropionate ammonia-lyase [Caulobacter sp. S6]QUD87365.1 diaminopropionate ammonia-lyase [Caulobacter sp. S6]